MHADAYGDFLRRKAIVDPDTGLTGALPALPSMMFPFQADIVRWALKRGRAAIFAGTGLGKSLMEMAWGAAVKQATGRDVLLLTPLAVAPQFVREAAKFGIVVHHVASQAEFTSGQAVTNYHKLDHFDLSKFGGVILDESSILKNETGVYRTRLIEECQSIPFRLAATATPAPNDFMELGNHAEFLGVMRYTDMLATFFTHDGGDTQKWVLKGHAENDFWKWMCSWSVMLRKPSDLGYENTGYDLPPLHQIQHTVPVNYAPSVDAGTLFPMQAISMAERLAARRDTIAERVRMAAAITPQDEPFLWWCNLNAESQALAKATGAVELSGADSEEEKARKILGFCDGTIRGLVTKPSLAGFGVNMQHCAWTGFVGLNDSFEQIYQAVRRFWRFGQTRAVQAHFIAAETEGAVVANIKRKEQDFERMCASMVKHMSDLSSMAVRGSVRDTPNYNPTQPMRLPSWLGEVR